MTMLNRRQAMQLGLGLAAGTTLAPGLFVTRASAAGTVKLVYVQDDSRPSDNAAYKAVYTAFQKANPGIDIDFQIIPWEEARAKLLTMGQGDTLPDAGRVAWVADFAAADMLLPIEDRVDSTMLDAFYPLQVQQCYGVGTDGKKHLYALPWFAGSHSVLVNKTLLDAAGLEVKDSWTTDEFTDYCKKLTIKGKQWGVTIDGSGIGDPVQIFLMAVYAYGGKWVDGDPQSAKPEPIVFNSKETVAGITWYTDLYLNGYAVPSAPSDTYKERDANFESGKAAIEWQGPWALTEIRDNFKQGGWELASMPLPTGPAGAFPASLGGGLAGLYRGAKKDGYEDQAFTWLKFLSSSEGQKLYCQANGMIPAAKSVQADPFWSQDPLYKGYLATMKGATLMEPIWAAGLDGLLDDIVPPLLQGVMLGQLKPADAAGQIQDQVVQGLQQNGITVPTA
jgi:ABC-type glycerol-3-phosphate transport system substrate-binding protein